MAAASATASGTGCSFRFARARAASSGSAGGRWATPCRSISTRPSRRSSTRARCSTVSTWPRSAIRGADQVVIVEGYMDAIAAHQFGHANVVAAMGTAVTEQQIGLVKRLSRNIVLALDADAAGQGATIRSLEMLPGALDQELTPIGAERDASRPRADTMIVWQRRFKTPHLDRALAAGQGPGRADPTRSPIRGRMWSPAAQPFLDFYVDAALSAVDLGDAPAKAAAVRKLIPLLEAAGDQVVQAHYAGVVARKLQLPESTVLRELRRAAVRTNAPRSRAQRPPPDRADAVLERESPAGAAAAAPRALPGGPVAGPGRRSWRRPQPGVAARPARSRHPAGSGARNDRGRAGRCRRRPRRGAAGAAGADAGAVSGADRARCAAGADPAREGALRLPDEPTAKQHRRRGRERRRGGADRSAAATLGALRAAPPVLSAAQSLFSRQPGRGRAAGGSGR